MEVIWFFVMNSSSNCDDVWDLKEMLYRYYDIYLLWTWEFMWFQRIRSLSWSMSWQRPGTDHTCPQFSLRMLHEEMAWPWYSLKPEEIWVAEMFDSSSNILNKSSDFFWNISLTARFWLNTNVGLVYFRSLKWHTSWPFEKSHLNCRGLKGATSWYIESTEFGEVKKKDLEHSELGLMLARLFWRKTSSLR